MSKLIVMGNSHITSVRRAARNAGIDRLIMRSSAHVDDLPDGTKAMKPESIDRLREETGPIFSMIGGNAHNAFGMVYPKERFDFFHPDYPDRPPRPDTWIIPYEQVHDSIIHRANTRVQEFRAVVSAFPGRVIHIESPPPNPSERWLSEQLAERMAAAGLTEYEVAARSLRYKLWRINSALFRAECERYGVPFIPVPPEACNPEGFLLKKYWKDPSHANLHYGALLLRQMMEHLDVASV